MKYRLLVLPFFLGACETSLADRPPPEAGPSASEATPPRRVDDVADEARPELSFSESRYDWGTAFRGERLEHTFVVKNTGDAPLIIEEVQPQCGCTLATDYASTLEPGQSTSISLTLETGSMTGKKEKFTTIISNALTENNKLWMEGEIVELLTLDPPMPRVEAVLGTRIKRAPTPVRLTPNLVADREIEVLTVRTRDGKLTARLTGPATPTAKTPGETTATGYVVHLEPELDGDDRTAFQDEALVVQVRVDDKTLDLRFPISIALRDRIEVSPSKSIHFSAKDTGAILAASGAQPTASPHKVLEILSAGDPDHHFKILEVEGTGEHFRTELETVTAGKHYRLRVFVAAGPEGRKRFVRGRFLIKTDDPAVPLISIPAMAQFPRKKK